VRIGKSAAGKMSGWLTTRVNTFVVEQTCAGTVHAGSFVNVVDPKDQPASITGPASGSEARPESDDIERPEVEIEKLGQKEEPTAEEEKKEPEKKEPEKKEPEKKEPEESKPADKQPTVDEKVEILKDPTVKNEDGLTPPPNDELA